MTIRGPGGRSMATQNFSSSPPRIGRTPGVSAPAARTLPRMPRAGKLVRGKTPAPARVGVASRGLINR